mmetsp:Transcript_30251/g.63304  ORF Transcript_30251/g.63304 Transcript_30251/m.63304 type:complete len:201 (-) Transcript_30251:569-1171(-)
MAFRALRAAAVAEDPPGVTVASTKGPVVPPDVRTARAIVATANDRFAIEGFLSRCLCCFLFCLRRCCRCRLSVALAGDAFILVSLFRYLVSSRLVSSRLVSFRFVSFRLVSLPTKYLMAADCKMEVVFSGLVAVSVCLDCSWFPFSLPSMEQIIITITKTTTTTTTTTTTVLFSVTPSERNDEYVEQGHCNTTTNVPYTN